MNLGRSFLRPGTVCEVVDNYGTVRAWSPGLFSLDDYNIIDHKPKDSQTWNTDRGADDENILPPIIPFLQPKDGSFSSPKIDDLIWIIHDETNPQLFFYIKLNQLSDKVKTILDSGDPNQEIVFVRDTDKGLYQIFFNDGTGIKLMKDNNYILIDPDGNIELSTEQSGRAISISGDSVCLGGKVEEADGIKTHAAYGERVEDALNAIYNILNQMMIAASGTPPYLTPLVAAMTPGLLQLPEQIAKITSNDVKVL